MPNRNRETGSKNTGRDTGSRDVGKEIDSQTPSPALKRAVARDLDEHADDPIHASDEPVKPDRDEDMKKRRR